MKKQTGFTLIELMVTTVILSLLLSVAIPSMKWMLDRGNKSVIGPIFEKSIRFARSQAVNRRQNVQITSISGTKDWSKGWRVQAITSESPIKLKLLQTIDELPGDFSFISSKETLTITSTGQADVGGSLTLSKSTCIGNQYVYSLQLSGTTSMSVNACP